MGKKPNIKAQNTKKPSKLLATAAIVVSVSLPFFMVKHFGHHESETYTQQKVSLPKLETVFNHTQPTKALPQKENLDGKWQHVIVHSGDTMGSIFKRLGLSAKNLQSVLQNNPQSKLLTNLKLNQELQFLIRNHTLEQLIVPVGNTQSLTVVKAGALYKTKLDAKKTTTISHYITGTVKGSLFTTAQRLNIPNKLMQQMTAVLNREIDFSRAVRTGDQFSMVYEAYYIEDKMVGVGDILAVSYTNKGKTHQALRHTKANGTHDYYSPEGKSLKKAFSRYPIKFSHISSTFAVSRYHPVLHYKRAHKGIDLAAPIGTPIRATGDGVISSIGRHNGYGNMIEIKHDKTYSTVYAHMLKFQKGLSRGSKIKRDQVIGYVGQTGLATGPHCHYELHVNNQPRNPTTIPLPTAAPITGRELASFRANAGTLLARLKLFEEANHAASGKRNIDVG